MGIFRTKSKKISPVTSVMSTRDLIRREAVVGGTLFGEVPGGHNRQFFCLDKHSWVWHEEWTDKQSNQPRSITTRYEVRSSGILKAQDNQPYHFVEKDEAINLVKAIRLYNKYVPKLVYGYNG